MQNKSAAKPSSMWRVRKTEQQLWTVGFYDPAGHWHPAIDLPTHEAASTRAGQLNGTLGKYVYLQTEESLWSCGYYGPSLWHPQSDHGSPHEAHQKVVKLNNPGEAIDPTPDPGPSEPPGPAAAAPQSLAAAAKHWASSAPPSNYPESSAQAWLQPRNPSQEILYRISVEEEDRTSITVSIMSEKALLREWPTLATLALSTHPKDHFSLELEVGLANIKLHKI